jgi:hypothetical protein
VYESGDAVGVISGTPSATGVMVVLKFLSLLQRLAYRQRACTSSLYERGALINEEADEMEEEREERDEISEIIDSGEEADEIEFANDDLRGNAQLIGEEEV